MKGNDHRADPERTDAARRTGRSHTRHPVPAQLSRCRDGALAPRDAAAIRAHLRSCPRCRRVQAMLSEVSRILGHQTSGRMPARIAVRIDGALIAQTAQRNGQWPPAPRRPSLYS
jgi:anti-sigma factor RsiW